MENQNQKDDFIPTQTDVIATEANLSSAYSKLELVSSILYGLRIVYFDKDPDLSSALYHCSSAIFNSKLVIDAYINQLNHDDQNYK